MRGRLLVLAGLLVLALTGCAGGAASSGEGGPAQEERLVIYTSHKEEVWWPIVKEFEERTGILVDVVTGGTNELLDRIGEETDHPQADVMFGGGVESLLACRDLFESYTTTQSRAIAQQYRAPEDLWTPFSSLPVVLIYNTKLVSPWEVTGWSDLLSSRFRGKIAFADPQISGSSFTALVTMSQALEGEWEENVQRFAANLEGRQLDSSGDVLTSVAGGSDWVGITLEETAMKRIAAGDDIAMVYPADGTSSVPDGCALVKGAPHQENARSFLDFTVSYDVQRLLPEQFYRRSVRQDVEAGENLIPLEEIPMVEYDVTWASQNRDAILMTWAFYLGGEEGEP